MFCLTNHSKEIKQSDCNGIFLLKITKSKITSPNKVTIYLYN